MRVELVDGGPLNAQAASDLKDCQQLGSVGLGEGNPARQLVAPG